MLDYDKILSEKVRKIKPSGIRKFFDILDTMDDVISLTVGQPDFVTPRHIRQAGIESIEEGKTYYTSNSGLLELRREISAYLSRRFSLAYAPEDEIIVTVGGSEAIDLAMRALLGPGDEVIVPVPSFVCYEPLAILTGAEAVTVETKEADKFKLTPAALREAISPRTKLLVLPYPSNPTGAVMTESDLRAVADILRGTGIIVLADEIYAELTYGREHVSFASVDGMRERTIITGGFSKAYAMTGWRLGYTAAPRELSRQMLKIHQFMLMCAPTASQFAGIEAMREGDADAREMAAEYDRRRKYILAGLRKIGIDCFEPEGAFYVFPYIGGFGMTSDEFCERLLYEKKVAIVPGTAFGSCGEGYARISYAYSIKHITLALERMGEFVENISR